MTAGRTPHPPPPHRTQRPGQLQVWWRVWWRGALTPLALGTAVAAVTLRHWPDWPFVADLGRMLDSLVFHLAALGGILALVLLALGGRAMAALTAALAVLAVGHTHLRQGDLSLPPTGGRGDLTVLWFNMLFENKTDPEVLIAALANSPADVVYLSEAAPLVPHLEALMVHFPHRLGCEQAPRQCEVLLVSRRPLEQARIRKTGWPRNNRMLAADVLLDNGARVTVQGVHLVKPWFFGFVEADDWFFADHVTQSPGPLLVLGDFNAAPWSRRVRGLVRACDLTLVSGQPATWPERLGPLGVPIDLALSRGGVAVTAIAPWGQGLGSNHRGLMVDIAVPTDDLPDTAPCTLSGQTPRSYQ